MDAAGNLGLYSGISTATTLAPPDTTPPTAPGTPTATAVSRSRIDLTWAAATDNVGVTGYRVERCQGAGCTSFVQIATPTGTSFSDTGLTRSTTYRYRVRARDAAGNLGPYSGIATATTKRK
jgi:chitodextrinase